MRFTRQLQHIPRFPTDTQEFKDNRSSRSIARLCCPGSCPGDQFSVGKRRSRTSVPTNTNPRSLDSGFPRPTTPSRANPARAGDPGNAREPSLAGDDIRQLVVTKPKVGKMQIP